MSAASPPVRPWPLPRATALRRWISPLAILVTWQLASSSGLLPDDLLASPGQILSSLVDLARTGVLLDAVLVSTQRVVIGFLLGATVALALALATGLSRIGEDILDPPMQMLRTLPHLGLIPLLILWFGIGETPKVTLIALGVAFPIYLNTVAGIRGIDRTLLEVAKVNHFSRIRRLREIVLPGTLPQMLVGVRQSLGAAWLSLIVAETVAADNGLGYVINHAREFAQTDVIVGGLLIYAALGLLTDAAVRLLERRALSWRTSHTA